MPSQVRFLVRKFFSLMDSPCPRETAQWLHEVLLRDSPFLCQLRAVQETHASNYFPHLATESTFDSPNILGCLPGQAHAMHVLNAALRAADRCALATVTRQLSSFGLHATTACGFDLTSHDSIVVAFMMIAKAAIGTTTDHETRKRREICFMRQFSHAGLSPRIRDLVATRRHNHACDLWRL